MSSNFNKCGRCKQDMDATSVFQAQIYTQNQQLQQLVEQQEKLLQQSREDKKQIQEKQENLIEEQKRYQQATNQIQQLNQQNTQSIQTIKALNESLQIKESNISSLNKQLNLLGEKLKQQDDIKLGLQQCEYRCKQLEEERFNQDTHIQGIEDKLQEKEAIYQQLIGKQKSMEIAYYSLESDCNQQRLENSQLQQAHEVAQQLLDSLKVENEYSLSQISTYKNLQKEYDSLKIDNTQLCLKLEQQISELNERSEAIMSLKDLLLHNQKEIQILNEVNENLKQSENDKKELQELRQEKEELNQYVPQKDESEYGYDIIIKMKSIKDLQDNNPESDQHHRGGLHVQQFNKDKNSFFENVLVVGMQGQRNKGKTFILNSLMDYNFPSEYHVSTPGICLKYHTLEGKNVVYVDSEGLNCPISINFEKNIHYQQYMSAKMNNSYIKTDQQNEQLLQQDIARLHWDLKATEQIQQDFILQSSNILIIVVSYLTLDDQKLIHTLSQRFVNDKKNPSKKQLYVVHNLKEYRQPKYVQDYFEGLKKIFPARQLSYNQIKKQFDDENNLILCDNVQPYINHIVMGHQGSEAGRVYNRFALEYLRHAIGIHQGESNFHVEYKLSDYLNKHLRSFVALKKDSDEANQTPSPSEQDQLVEYNKEKQSLCLQKGWQIDRIKELQVNVFGSLEKDCYYSLVNVNGNEQERQLIIEIPGTATQKTIFDKKTGQFTILINQNNKIESTIGEIYATTRKFEEKLHIIQVCDQNENWIYEKKRTENEGNGISKFYFIKEIEDKLD